MNPFEMVVLIVAIVAVARVFREKYRAHRPTEDNAAATAPQAIADTRMMADEIRRLRERVAVLERIATDGEGPAKLDREIEALRSPRQDPAR